MENPLFNKKTKSLSFYLNQSRMPEFLYEVGFNYIMNICMSKEYHSLSPVQDINFLIPSFRTKINEMLKTYEFHKPEHVAKPFETYRSFARQRHLYNSGASKIRNYSMHHYGLAVDLVNFAGKKWQWNLDYQELREYAKKKNITVLNWEQCHFQAIEVGYQGVIIQFVDDVIRCIQDLVNIKIDGIVGPVSYSNFGINIDRIKYYFESQKKLKNKDL